MSWSESQATEGRAGEARVNLLRLAAILVFYGNHVLQALVFSDDPALRGAFHDAVTSIVVAWSLVVVGVQWVLVRGRWSLGLAHAVCFADVALATLLLCVAAAPRSMLGSLYFLVIATTPLRLSRRLVVAATLECLAGYLVFLGFCRYGLELPVEDRLSRPNQIVLALALAVAGLLAGQAVRQARRLVAATGDSDEPVAPQPSQPQPTAPQEAP